MRAGGGPGGAGGGGQQHTLGEAFQLTGPTLRSGAATTAHVCPAPPDHGIRFVRAGVEIPAHVDHVVDTRLATTLGRDGVTVSMVEHVCAALVGAGVDNARVEVDGDEIPALDGSAWAWFQPIRAVAQPAPRRWHVVQEVVEVHQGDAWARLEPADQFELDLTIRFAHPAIGTQRYRAVVDPGEFAAGIARARTFGFLEDAERLRAAGLARGASLGNTVVYGPDGVMNPGGLLRPDEAVRHKALDAVGDAALVGAPLRGRLVGWCAGHTLHHALFRALLTRAPLAEAVSP